jgi:DNA segregation ATPase FtsK/SpoIIIE-like protein
MSQEHIKAFSALTSNSQAVNLMNGFINDLSAAAMEVLKEMKVSIYTLLLFSCIWVVSFNIFTI